MVVQGRPSDAYIVTSSGNFFTGIVIILSLTLASDRIPEYMSDIKTKAEFLLDIYDGILNLEKIALLKKFMKKKIIYLSAGGVVYLKRSFILSAVGALFTYGLLILNLKSAIE
ncbi:hypothetical protein TNIN_446031 [Trichonephila inaurata madagascariensis]|uniref:Uncharacterized protein n=1 Tax=Trichonephila inaurata madagascariensis TaxID=2747483 RepID=A0A8X6IP95_9ARAC|nr:hypothetical protein TNIN_446031 [Trichonephila inaurata madagascariensis]